LLETCKAVFALFMLGLGAHSPTYMAPRRSMVEGYLYPDASRPSLSGLFSCSWRWWWCVLAGSKPLDEEQL